MSRIIHGPSSDVKTMRVLPRSSAPSAYAGASFQSFGLTGTLTQEEADLGLQAARQEGAREAESRLIGPLKAALDNVEKVLDEISAFRRELFKESEIDIMELIRSISKRVVMKELSVSPELMKTVVEKALSILEKQKKVSLKINPADFNFYQAAKPDFLQKFKGIDEFELTVTPDVPQGTCLARSKSVELDLDLEKMVDHLLTQVQAAKAQVNPVNDEGDSI